MTQTHMRNEERSMIQPSLLAYVADLELEVDRLRKLTQLLQHESRQTVQKIKFACEGGTEQSGGNSIGDIAEAADDFSKLLKDIYDSTGYHPAHDQVVAIAVRPLVEQIFRSQQRMLSTPAATLHLDLTSEHVDWFPARLRHILDNLISNALRYRDPAKGESRVSLALRRSTDGYELRVSDNGLGMPWSKRAEAFELYHRAGPTRAAGLGVGVAIVKLLLDQSGGSLTVESGEGQGTSFVAVLPYYTIQDHLG